LLLVLVCVFYTYVNVSIMLRWAPSFLDSFLPFAIASLEIPPAYFLGHVAAWNALLAALWLGASCGFFITIKWSPPSHFGKEREAHRTFHRMLGELMAIAAICGLAMGVLGTLVHLSGRSLLVGYRRRRHGPDNSYDTGGSNGDQIVSDSRTFRGQ
jgi:hypothetical protein